MTLPRNLNQLICPSEHREEDFPCYLDEGWHDQVLNPFPKNVFRIAHANRVLKDIYYDARKIVRDDAQYVELLDEAIQNIPDEWREGDYHLMAFFDNEGLSKWQFYKMLQGKLQQLDKACLTVSMLDVLLTKKYGANNLVLENVQIRPALFTITEFNRALYKAYISGGFGSFKSFKQLMTKTRQVAPRGYIGYYKSHCFFKDVSNGKPCTLTTAMRISDFLLEQALARQANIQSVPINPATRSAIHEVIT